MSNPPKRERLAEFFKRLAAAPAASSADQAFRQIERILTEVENQMTDIPDNPDAFRSDGRMYPPQRDSERPVEGRPDLVRYRHASDNTIIRTNGAIEIRSVIGGAVPKFEKPGKDGRKVNDP